MSNLDLIAKIAQKKNSRKESKPSVSRVAQIPKFGKNVQNRIPRRPEIT